VPTVEEHILRSEAIEVGRQIRDFAPKNSRRFGLQIIRGEQENIGPRRCAGDRRAKHESI
jgi:hypothetical protein